MHDLLLFDLDGTLTDPLVGITRCINFALEARGHEQRTSQDIARFIGPPIDEAFRVLAETNDVSEIDVLVSRYRERYADIGYAENRLYPGVAPALRSLASRNIAMAVCTSKRRDFAEKILKLFELDSHFRFIHGGDVGITKRDQIRELVSDGNVSTAAVMIGDRAVDVTAAHQNGLHAAGVLWGYGSRAELTSTEPRYLFEMPGDLLQLGDG